jgi:hypothetical protein
MSWTDSRFGLRLWLMRASHPKAHGARTARKLGWRRRGQAEPAPQYALCSTRGSRRRDSRVCEPGEVRGEESGKGERESLNQWVVRVPEKSRGSQRSPGGAARLAEGPFFCLLRWISLCGSIGSSARQREELAIARRALQDQHAARGRPTGPEDTVRALSAVLGHSLPDALTGAQRDRECLAEELKQTHARLRTHKDWYSQLRWNVWRIARDGIFGPTRIARGGMGEERRFYVRHNTQGPARGGMGEGVGASDASTRGVLSGNTPRGLLGRQGG